MTVRLHGDIDLATVPHVRAALVDLHERGHRHLLVDLARVDIIDSTGIGVLIGALRRARAAGGTVRLGERSVEVDKVFALLGLSDLFDGALPAEGNPSGDDGPRPTDSQLACGRPT